MSEALTVKDSGSALAPSPEVAKELEVVERLELKKKKEFGPVAIGCFIACVLSLLFCVLVLVLHKGFCTVLSAREMRTMLISITSMVSSCAAASVSVPLRTWRLNANIRKAKAALSPVAMRYLEAVKKAKTAEELKARNDQIDNEQLRLEQEKIENANQAHVLEEKTGYR